ncbi:unnamed protein product, partial [Brassica napus]
MSNPWATGSRSSASPPSSCTSGDKRNLIPPDPPDPLSHLPLAQYPPLFPTIPSRRSRAIASSTVAPLLSTPTVQQISASLSSTDIAPYNIDTEMVFVFSDAAPLPSEQTTTPPPPTSVRPQTSVNPPPLPSNPILVENIRRFEDKTLKRIAPATISASGRPTVMIPDTVFQKGTDLHKDFIVCVFNGRSLPFSQIQSVLNHLWGKGKRLEIHNNPSSRTVLVRITSDYLKQKILEKGYWYVGDSLFHTQQWTSTTKSTAPSFSSIKIWVHLTGIPLDLRHQDGLSLVAGLVGEPKETDDFTKNLVSPTLAHAKVEVDLTKPLPDVVEFTRQTGEVVEVLVTYPWLPPSCSHCKELGHIAKNCLLIPPPQKAPPPPAPRTKIPHAPKEPPVANHHHSPPSKTPAKPSAKTTPKTPIPINPPIAHLTATTTLSIKPSPFMPQLDPTFAVPLSNPLESPSAG